MLTCNMLGLFLSEVFQCIALGILCICAVGTCVGFIPLFGWVSDLASHFRVQYCVLLFSVVLFFLFNSYGSGLWISCFCLLANLAVILPLYKAKRPQPDESTCMLRIVNMNVNFENTNCTAALDYIHMADPDIVMMEEITEQWMQGMAPFLKTYSSYQYVACDGPFGIGLFSRIPLDSIEIHQFRDATTPSIVANMTLNYQPVTLLVVHPPAPLLPHMFNARNRLFDNIIQDRNSFAPNLIMIGDFNNTSWSASFQRFIRQLNLRDTRKGLGIQASWPAYCLPLLIPIDHCLVSDRFVTLKRSIGPNIGSDHYPIFVSLGMENTN